MADNVPPADPDDLQRRRLRDEIRLAHDEERLEQDERWIRRNWRLALGLGGLLVLTIAALVLSVVALNRDIDTVTAAALAGGAVTKQAIADGAVGSRAVAANGLTGGASIDGAAHVAITTCAPDGQDEWIASAAAIGTPSAPWSRGDRGLRARRLCRPARA